MSTVPQTSNHRTSSDDAPRAERAARAEVAPPNPPKQSPEPAEATLDDRYDNVACTD